MLDGYSRLVGIVAAASGRRRAARLFIASAFLYPLLGVASFRAPMRDSCDQFEGAFRHTPRGTPGEVQRVEDLIRRWCRPDLGIVVSTLA
jgi:hypothetical protein